MFSPNCIFLGVSAWLASSRTFSKLAPDDAATTAANVPSTSGAEHSVTFCANSVSSSSIAVSVLSMALPKSIITIMASASAIDSIAVIILTASVPIGCASSSTPAAMASRQCVGLSI